VNGFMLAETRFAICDLTQIPNTTAQTILAWLRRLTANAPTAHESELMI
jgi:hypothetical protein